MSFMNELRKGAAQETADKSAGLISFRAAGGYLDSEIGIYDTVLPETPAAAVAQTLYTISDRFEDVETIIGLQYRYRAASMSQLLDLEDTLMNCWSRRVGGTLGSVKLVQSAWSSGASLGQDGNDRLLRSANFYLTVHRPNSNDNI